MPKVRKDSTTIHGVLNVFQKERPHHKKSLHLLRAYLDEYATPVRKTNDAVAVQEGPGDILQDADEFLDWYLVRRIPRGLTMLPEAACMVADLCTWMAERGLVPDFDARVQASYAVKAAGQIPIAQKLEVLLSEFTGTPSIGTVDQVLDSRFEVKEVKRTRLVLVCQETGRKVVVHVPSIISENTRRGWKLTLLIEKRNGEWSIREPGFVDPF
ncbi:MAG TPA: hypothetical protein VGO93_10555 [Candidatus Xenobia bacterium]|jgi:hypothetical protein